MVAEAGNNVVPPPGGRSVQQFKHIRQTRLAVAHFVCQTLINYPKSYIFVKRCKDSFLVPVTDVVGSWEGQVLVLNELLYLLYPGKGKGGAQSLL